MKLSIKQQFGFKLKTQKDDKIGDRVVDFLIDEKDWKIKYLKIKRSNFVYQEHYYLPILFIHKVDFRDKRFKLFLSEKEITRYSRGEDVKTVSEEFGQKLNEILKNENYWKRKYYPPVSIPSITHNYDTVAGMVDAITHSVSEAEIETTLRSLKEMKGYSVKLSQDQTAYVKDFILDTVNWKIKEMVVGKRFSFFWNSKFLLNVNMTDGISCVQNTIYVEEELEPKDDLKYYVPSKAVNKNVYGVHFDYRGIVQEK